MQEINNYWPVDKILQTLPSAHCIIVTHRPSINKLLFNTDFKQFDFLAESIGKTWIFVDENSSI